MVERVILRVDGPDHFIQSEAEAFLAGVVRIWNASPHPDVQS